MSGPDVDVVVAGAGGAGLAAALAARQRGASVVVLEHRVSFREGCNTAMSTAMVPAGGTRWQAEAGIVDSPAQFLADVMAKTKGTANPQVANALTTVAPELVAWMADHLGVPMAIVTDFHYPGHCVDRCHTVPDRAGRTLHGHLLAHAQSAGIDVVTPAHLVSVEVDSAGAVGGATWSFPDGATESVRTANVVLAAGGFGANAERVARHLPEISGAWHFGSDGNTGDALRIGDALGADMGWLDAYQGHGSVATPHGVLVTWATVMHGAVIVNLLGDRFDDETSGYSEFARRVLDQPGGEAWVVFDARIDAACRSFKDHQDLAASGAIRTADSIDELAATTGLSAPALVSTLADAAASANHARPDAFGRTAWEAPLAAPYAAVKVTGALFHTQGGLLVDGAARVLRAGAPVTGLFAAGGSACGMSGHGADGYLAGNGLLAALGLGYLAGRAVRTTGQ